MVTRLRASEARRGKEVAEDVVTDPPREHPFGGGGVHFMGQGGTPLRHEDWVRTLIDAIPSNRVIPCVTFHGLRVTVNRVTGQMVFLP